MKWLSRLCSVLYGVPFLHNYCQYPGWAHLCCGKYEWAISEDVWYLRLQSKTQNPWYMCERGNVSSVGHFWVHPWYSMCRGNWVADNLDNCVYHRVYHIPSLFCIRSCVFGVPSVSSVKDHLGVGGYRMPWVLLRMQVIYLHSLPYSAHVWICWIRGC